MRAKNKLIAASYDLAYEVNMLQARSRALASGITTGSNLNNALLESFAIHLRNLADFLYHPKKQKTDVLAEDFFPSSDIWFKLLPNKSPKLITATRKADKQVAHLTYTRSRLSQDQKCWDFADLTQEVMSALHVFFSHVDRGLMHKIWEVEPPTPPSRQIPTR